MKILLLLSKIDQTGMTTNTYDLGMGLIEKGHEVHLITSGCGYENNEELERLFNKFKLNGFIIHQFIASDKADLHRSRLVKTFFDIWAIIQIVITIYFINANVIHVSSPYMSFIPYFLRKKFISTLHVNDLVPGFKYKNATKLIAISRETRDYAMKVFGYKSEDISLIRHGVDVRFAKQATLIEKDNIKLQFNIPENKIIIGLVGSVEYRKGHDLLLKSIEKFGEELKSRIHIVFIGSSKDGKTKEWLNDNIIDSGCKNIVSVFEYQDPKSFYDIMDIFVLPSRLEGFGLVCIEAMLSGCCVVRSDTEGALDQICNDVDGYIFESENFSELSQVLESLILNEKKRLLIANVGREKALKNFTNNIMAENTLRLYNKMIEIN